MKYVSSPEERQKKKKKPGRFRWPVRVFFMSVAISAVLSLVSNELLGRASLPVSFAILLAFIAIGILFDIVGVAVTSADERPFHAMASHKEPGAREALRKLREKHGR